MSEDQSLQARLQFALDASRRAAGLILEYYRSTDLVVERKKDLSPVTAADRRAERLLRAEIARAFPEDAVLGEEFGETTPGNADQTSDGPGANSPELKQGYRWLLDPVDGTKSFIHGVPLFGTMIGLEHQGRYVLGVCRFPALDEVVYAAEGGGTWWQSGDDDPKRAHVSPVDNLGEALFCTTTVTGWKKVGRDEAFVRLSHRARLTRGWGDCYGHMLVATGRAELMVDPKLNPWDAAALVPILAEAGGSFVDFDGQCSIDSGNGLSVNAALKNEVLKLLHDET